MAASSSARLLSSCIAWPLVQTHRVLCRATSSSSSRQRSLLITGFLALVSQFRFFQAWIHSVMPFFTYSESVITSTSHGSLMARSPSMAAVSSIRLLVVWGAQPNISRLRLPYRRIHAQPPGPGLPIQAPSVMSRMVFIRAISGNQRWFYIAIEERIHAIENFAGFMGVVDLGAQLGSVAN